MKSDLSAVIVDNIEGLIEYNPVGPRFSNYLVQAIRDLISQPLKKNRRMLVLATTSCPSTLSEQNLTDSFSWRVKVRCLTRAEHVAAVLEEDERFTSEERHQFEIALKAHSFSIGIKHLLDLLDLISKVDPGYRIDTLLQKLNDEGAFDSELAM